MCKESGVNFVSSWINFMWSVDFVFEFGDNLLIFYNFKCIVVIFIFNESVFVEVNSVYLVWGVIYEMLWYIIIFVYV